MTDDLIARLRATYSNQAPLYQEAADALEAQARRIAELESKVTWETASNIATAKLNGNLLERIAELTAALKPFAKYQTEYSDEYSKHPIVGVFLNELRAARAALGEKE